MGSIPRADSGVISGSLPWRRYLVTSLDVALSHRWKPIESEEWPLVPLLPHSLKCHCCGEILKSGVGEGLGSFVHVRLPEVKVDSYSGKVSARNTISRSCKVMRSTMSSIL